MQRAIDILSNELRRAREREELLELDLDTLEDRMRQSKEYLENELRRYKNEISQLEEALEVLDPNR